MVTDRRRWSGAVLALALGTGGCWMAAPSDWIYAVGVAKIGETYHLFAPLCDDERLQSVEVYDNAASSNATAAPADETAFTYWLAEAPVTADAQQGLVAVGNDEEFERVLVKAGTKAAFPAEVIGLSLQVTWPEGRKKVGYGVDMSEVPSYPADTDPTTVKYAIDDDDRKPRLLTRAEIDTTFQRCARDNV